IAQSVWANGRLQVLPHDPQFSGSVARSVGSPPQSHPPPLHMPLLQTEPHWPQFCSSSSRSAHSPEQHDSPPPQALSHMPQWSVSANTSTHSPLQSVCPWGHTHEPPTQDCAAEHWLPHAPQFSSSLDRTAQVSPPQHVSLAVQVLPPQTHSVSQLPLQHTSPVPQAAPPSQLQAPISQDSPG